MPGVAPKADAADVRQLVPIDPWYRSGGGRLAPALEISAVGRRRTASPLGARVITYAILFASAIFVAYVEGFLNPFWVWNVLPLGLAVGLLARARRRDSPTGPALAFGVGAVGATLFVHAAWLFDWGGTATGSSTSGLIFLFLPLYALVIGAAFYGLFRLVLAAVTALRS